MATPRDILDERLVRGEITVDEHAKLLAQIAPQASTPQHSVPTSAASSGHPAQTSGAPAPAPTAPGTGSILWNALGVVVAAMWIGLTNSVVNDIIASCVQRGNPESFCRTSGVNWALVYGSYAIAIAVGASSFFALVRHKFLGSAGTPPR